MAGGTLLGGNAARCGLDDLCFDRTGGLYLTDACGSSVLHPQGQVCYLAPKGAVRKPISGNLARERTTGSTGTSQFVHSTRRQKA
jgi:hypothetical protein